MHQYPHWSDYPSVNTPLSAENLNQIDEAVDRSQDMLDTLHESNIHQKMIVLWSGSPADIPPGWALCDGTNETPDLRDRFVLGAGEGTAYSFDQSGGNNEVSLSTNAMPQHTHAVLPSQTHAHVTGESNEHDHGGTTDDTQGHIHDIYFSPDGAHNHWMKTRSQSHASRHHDTDEHRAVLAQPPGTRTTQSTPVLSDGKHYHSISIAQEPGHTHPMSTEDPEDHQHVLEDSGEHDDHEIGEEGEGASHDNLPPFYALSFIMKL